MSIPHIRTPFSLAAVGLVILLFSGCLADLVNQPDIEDPWPVQVEFFPVQEDRSENNEESVFTTVKVQLVGPTLEEDQRIPFTLNGDKTNAINGRHFLVRTNSPVTIPAGETTATIEIEILPNSLEDGARRFVVLDLQGNGEVGTIPTYDRYTLTIEGN